MTAAAMVPFWRASIAAKKDLSQFPPANFTFIQKFSVRPIRTDWYGGGGPLTAPSCKKTGSQALLTKIA